MRNIYLVFVFSANSAHYFHAYLHIFAATLLIMAVVSFFFLQSYEAIQRRLLVNSVIIINFW